MRPHHLERFYKAGVTVNDFAQQPDGPIKSFTLRGKDTRPYQHDSRLFALTFRGPLATPTPHGALR